MLSKCKCCGQEINEIIVEEIPKIVGHTTKRHGFNGFKTIEIGSPIIEYKNYLYLFQESEKDGFNYKVVYGKDKLNKL